MKRYNYKPKCIPQSYTDLLTSYEEVFYQEHLLHHIIVQKLHYTSTKDEEINTELDVAQFESVDEIVAKEIEAIERPV